MRSRFISYINIYNRFAGFQYIISFSLLFVSVLEFHLWRWNTTFLDIEMKELSRSTQIQRDPDWYSQHKTVDPYLSSMSQTSCKRKKPSRWKNKDTHTHSHTHTHTHSHTHTYTHTHTHTRLETLLFVLHYQIALTIFIFNVFLPKVFAMRLS